MDAQVELVATNPWDDPAALNAANSLGKVPCLITDDKQAIYDSPVICEFLIAQADAETQARLLPTGDARWPGQRSPARFPSAVCSFHRSVHPRTFPRLSW